MEILNKILSNKLTVILLFVVFILGGLVLFVPVQNLIVLLIGIGVLWYFIQKPDHCFYLLVFTIPFNRAFAIGGHELPFNQTQVLIFISFMAVFIKYFILNKNSVSLKTPIDYWFIPFFILYFIAGFITPITHRGYQGFINFIELFCLFYLVVFFIRAEIIPLKNFVYALLVTMLFQAFLGIFQSFTGIGNDLVVSNRNIFAYLGMGGRGVFHGQGTYDHFNNFGAFLCTLSAFFIPVAYFSRKNYLIWSVVIAILGIYISYSRNAQITIVFIGILALNLMFRDKLKSILITVAIFIFTFGLFIGLKDTEYIKTVSPREPYWHVAMASINEDTGRFLFGHGEKSAFSAIMPYLPTDKPTEKIIKFWLPHNFYLYTWVEYGLFGLGLILLFFIFNIITFIKNIINNNSQILSYSGLFFLLACLILGIYDMFFVFFFFKVYLYIILGIVYGSTALKDQRPLP